MADKKAINVRFSEKDLSVIRKAADLNEVSLSRFIKLVAIAEAERITK